MRTLLSIAVLCASGAAAAQPVTAWVNEPGGVSVAVDAADNVYTARWDYNPAGDIYLAKRNLDGVAQWEVRHDNTDPTRHEVATWVDTDREGNILVSGTLRSGYTSPVNANSILMKFSPGGQLLWRRVYDTAFDGSSTRRLLVDTSNHVYVLGIGITPNGQRTTVKKFAPNGDTVWTWFDSAGLGAPVNFKFTPDAALLVSARSITGSANGYTKLSLNGQTLWSLAGPNSLTVGDAAGDSSGHSYLINGPYGAGSNSMLRKVAPDGSTVWERAQPISGLRVEVASDGSPLVSGTPAAGFGAAFAKSDAAGNLLWSNLDADGPAVAVLAPAQMKLDGADNAYLAAWSMTAMAVTRVNADGSTGWTALVPGSGYASALALGQQQRVFVTGGVTARIDQGATPPPPTTADLSLTLTDAPDPVRVGANLVYTALVRNQGPLAATLVNIGQSLPSNVTFVSAVASQGSCTGARTLGCSLGTLVSGASATVVVTVRPRLRGTLSTTASVSASQPDPTVADNSATARTQVIRR